MKIFTFVFFIISFLSFSKFETGSKTITLESSIEGVNSSSVIIKSNTNNILLLHDNVDYNKDISVVTKSFQIGEELLKDNSLRSLRGKTLDISLFTDKNILKGKKAHYITIPQKLELSSREPITSLIIEGDKKKAQTTVKIPSNMNSPISFDISSYINVEDIVKTTPDYYYNFSFINIKLVTP